MFSLIQILAIYRLTRGLGKRLLQGVKHIHTDWIIISQNSINIGHNISVTCICICFVSLSDCSGMCFPVFSKLMFAIMSHLTTRLYFTLHCTERFTSLHCNTLLQCCTKTALQWSAVHCTAQFYTAIHQYSKSWVFKLSSVFFTATRHLQHIGINLANLLIFACKL